MKMKFYQSNITKKYISSISPSFMKQQFSKNCYLISHISVYNKNDGQPNLEFETGNQNFNILKYAKIAGQ